MQRKLTATLGAMAIIAFWACFGLGMLADRVMPDDFPGVVYSTFRGGAVIYSWLAPHPLAATQPAAVPDWYFDRQEPSRGEVKSVTIKDGPETCAFRWNPLSLLVIYVAWSPKFSNTPAILLNIEQRAWMPSANGKRRVTIDGKTWTFIDLKDADGLMIPLAGADGLTEGFASGKVLTIEDGKRPVRLSLAEIDRDAMLAFSTCSGMAALAAIPPAPGQAPSR